MSDDLFAQGLDIWLPLLTQKQRNQMRWKLSKYDQCPAVFYHGPGHQSKSLCEVRSVHTTHEVDGREWEGPEGYSRDW